ncbi:JAB domain-containing protein [Solitalea canadensis]|nr:JAB domain-containing protein [Solitalea canadensis]
MKNKVPEQIAEVFLKYKPALELSEALRISSSKDVYEFFMQVWDMELIEFIEEFKILLLNRANKVLGFYKVTSGGISSALVDPELIFAAALKAGASGIILCHNHPSCNVSPSVSDKHLTQKLKQALKKRRLVNDLYILHNCSLKYLNNTYEIN